MVDHNNISHPDLDRLGLYVTDQLNVTEAAKVERHVAQCAVCHAEAARLKLFLTSDQDADLNAAALWDETRFKLDRSYQDQVKPTLEPEHEALTSTPSIFPWHKWVLPMAAAAVLAMLLLGPGAEFFTGAPEDRGQLRGDGPLAKVIHGLQPAGLIHEAPDHFIWRSEGEFESYTLSIFTPDLDVIHQQTDIPDTTYAVPDSLAGLFTTEGTYLWEVKGYRGLAEATVSSMVMYELSDEK